MTEKMSESIGGRLPLILRVVADKLNAKGVPDAEILRRGIRRVAEEEGISIEALEKELTKELKKPQHLRCPHE